MYHGEHHVLECMTVRACLFQSYTFYPSVLGNPYSAGVKTHISDFSRSRAVIRKPDSPVDRVVLARIHISSTCVLARRNPVSLRGLSAHCSICSSSAAGFAYPTTLVVYCRQSHGRTPAGAHAAFSRSGMYGPRQICVRHSLFDG
ncbi:hypothetical protein BaRGS_00026103 [Batillaria attramentaria]|uniref:Uncharacterized protein n=1 Tax=Batillaria attramentaria TaxID=370345 RepID=A0ABD0K5X6_9CAEN